MNDLPTLFEDHFAIVDPATDVEVRFIDYLEHIEERTRLRLVLHAA